MSHTHTHSICTRFFHFYRTMFTHHASPLNAFVCIAALPHVTVQPKPEGNTNTCSHQMTVYNSIHKYVYTLKWNSLIWFVTFLCDLLFGAAVAAILVDMFTRAFIPSSVVVFIFLLLFYHLLTIWRTSHKCTYPDGTYCSSHTRTQIDIAWFVAMNNERNVRNDQFQHNIH